MEKKILYIIQNQEGKFYKNNMGYPHFITDFEFAERYDSEESVKNFLRSEYVTEKFKKEFEYCIYRKLIIMIE